MDYLENINRLIDAKTAENNFLAMQMMLNILHYSFEEAYTKLKIDNHNDELLSLAIANIEIRYEVDMHRIIYAPSSYADIVRTVYYKGNPEPDTTIKLYADDDSILDLGEFGGVEELVQIREDLSGLCAYVEKLFFMMSGEL